MLRPSNLPLMLGLLVWAPLVVAQSTLGELLDTGAKVMSADEFKNEVVGQRVVAGPTATGGTLEVMYVGNGAGRGHGNTSPSHASKYRADFGRVDNRRKRKDMYEHAHRTGGRRSLRPAQLFRGAVGSGSSSATSISYPTPIRIAAPRY